MLYYLINFMKTSPRQIVVAIAVLLCAPIIAFAQPRMEIENNGLLVFPTITKATGPLEGKLVVKNTGNQELVIGEIKPGCGCTTPKIDKTNLAPGESTTLHLGLNVTGSVGDITKYVSMKSNDPLDGNRTLTLKLTIQPILSFAPNSFVILPDAEIGKESIGKMTITNTGKESIVLSNIKAFEQGSNAAIHATLSKTEVKPGESTELTVKHIVRTSGYYSGIVSIKANHPDYVNTEIFVYGKGLVPPQSDIQSPKN